MSALNTTLKVIASLNKQLSKRQLKKDLKELNDLYVQIGANIRIDKHTKDRLHRQIKELQKAVQTIDITLNTAKADAAIASAQKAFQEKASKTPISLDIEVKRKQAAAEIELLGKKYSRLFTNLPAKQKYENLLSSAYSASDEAQLNAVRNQMTAFTAEIKANGLASRTLGDKWKDLIKKGRELLSAANIVHIVFSQVRQSVSAFLQLDTAMTELYQASADISSREQFSGMLAKWNKLAQNLAVTTESLIRSATGWSEMGLGLDVSEKLAQITAVFEKTAKISNEKAASVLIATARAFPVIDGFDEDDIVERVEAVGNKINAAGNSYAATSEQISDGLQSTGAELNAAGNDLDETIALIAAAEEIYQNPDDSSRMLKAVSLRLSGQAEALKAMGEDTGPVSEDITEIQRRIYELTDSKVTITTDTGDLKSTYQILLEIGKIFDTLGDRQQAGLLEAVFGSSDFGAGASLLLNFEELERIKNSSQNAAGSMSEEYAKYMESAEAHIAIFKEKLLETYAAFMSGDLIKYAADIGSGVLNLINATDLLKHSILTLLALKIGKGITSVGTCIAATAKQMNLLGSALQKVKSLPSNEKSRESALKKIGNETKALTENNLKLLLSQKKLGAEDKITLLMQHNLTEEEAKAKLEKMGLISATNAQSTANLKEAASTGVLKNAMTSLKTSVVNMGRSIWATMAANPLTVALTAATAIFSVVTSLASSSRQRLEDLREQTKEAAAEANTTGDEIAGLASKYLSLSEAVKTDADAREEFMSTQTELLTKLGMEGEGIDKLIAKYGSLSNAIREASLDALQKSQIDLTAGIGAAKEELLNAAGKGFWGGKNIINASGKDALKAFRELEKAGIIDSGSYGSGGGALVLTGEDTVEGALENFKLLQDALNALRESDAFAGGELSENPVFEGIYNRYNEMKDKVEAYNSSIDNLNKNLAQQAMLTALQGREIPKTAREFEAFRKELTDTAVADSQFIGDKEEITAAVNNYLSTVPEFEIYYRLSPKMEHGSGNTINNSVLEHLSASFSAEEYKDQIDSVQSSVSALRSALDSLHSGELDKIDVIDLIQQFPSLTPYVDLTADGFGNLSEGLSALINQQPDSLIQSLQELKDSLNTEEEREQADLLIDSLQRLCSYGDSGAEAYAAAVGHTWNDTSSVIEGIITQFEKLAKVQETVADGLTVSASAAYELADMYPEILTKAAITSDGQITLNEDVVNSILEGDRSIIDGQIAKLEADRAELAAKKSSAEARLRIAKQVGEGESLVSKEAAENMAGNMVQYHNVVADVAENIAENMAIAAADFAESMHENGIAAQVSITNVQKKTHDLSKSIRGAAKGLVTGSLKIYEKGHAEKKDSLKLKRITTQEEFTSQLELDIESYTDAISNIDSQIETLKNLQAVFETNGGIGESGYSDKIKELEKEKDQLNSAVKNGSDSAGNEFSETMDFFDRRIKALDSSLSLLKANLSSLPGSFAKNSLLDAQISLNEEKINNYSDALALYAEKADEAFAKLPADLAKKVKEGAVSLTTFTGDSGKELTETIKDYETWAGKVNDCRQELSELKDTLRALELEKFNNLINDFTTQYDLHETANTLIGKQITLLKEAGLSVGEAFYTAQAGQAKKQLGLLEEEKDALIHQLAAALSSGHIEKGTDEWLEMVKALSDLDGRILDCKASIEEFDNAVLALHEEVFQRIQDRFSGFHSELEHLLSLFQDADVSDEAGDWTKEGLAQLGLLAQQYELARRQVQQYNDEIDKLNSDYLAGKYSAAEYADKLSELTDAQWDAADAASSAEDAIIKLNEARVEKEIEGIEKEIDAYKELVDAQIDALRAAKDLHDYEETIAEKTKSIDDLERQIAAMQGDNTAAAAAKRKKLEEELAQAKKDLEDAEYDHSIEAQEDALNKQYEAFEEEKRAEIEALQESLKETLELLSQSFDAVRQNTDLIGQEITDAAQSHGVRVSEALIAAWQNGESAVARYGETLSAQTSAFLGSLFSVETEVWNLQAQADVAAVALSGMFTANADNLIAGLTAAWQSEETLNVMTNALQESLRNTLERGYDVSALTAALAAIASGAQNAAAAANSAADAFERLGAKQNSAKKLVFVGIDSSTGESIYRNLDNGMEETASFWRDFGSTYGISESELSALPYFAPGAHEGKEGRYAADQNNHPAPKLIPVQNDRLFPALFALHPEALLNPTVPPVRSLLPPVTLPEIQGRNIAPSVHMDKMVQIDHVDGANLKQVEQMIARSQDNFINKMYNGIKYRRI